MEEAKVVYPRPTAPLPPRKRENIGAYVITVNPPNNFPPTIINNYSRSLRKSASSRTQIALVIAVVILVILSMVFITLYFRSVMKDRPIEPDHETSQNSSIACNLTKKEEHPDANVNSTMPNSANKFEKCRVTKLDLLYVLDGSGSVKETNFEKMKEFVMNLTTRFHIGPDKTRVAVERFSGKDFIIFPINFTSIANNNITALNYAIEHDVNYGNGGATATGQALMKAREKIFNEDQRLTRPNVVKVLILLTDGEENDGDEQLKQAEMLKNDGVKIITVGIGDTKTLAKFKGELKKLASYSADSERKLAFIAEFDNLDTIGNEVAKEACLQFEHPN